MQTKIGICKLKPNTQKQLLEMIEKTKDNTDLCKAHLKDKGYYWDSLFLDSRPDGDYLIYVTKSPDWSKIKKDDTNPLNSWTEMYMEWKDETWQERGMKPVSDLLDIDLSF